MSQIKKRKWLILILIIQSLVIRGQTNYIDGILIDKDENSVPYISVYVSEKSVLTPITGTISNMSGQFSLAVKRNTDYTLHISGTGYRKKEIAISTDTITRINLGIIRIDQDTIKLNEIIVKPLVIVTDETITYNIISDPTRKTSNMKQILEKVPMLSISNDGKITVGSGEKDVIVTRNGRKDALFKGKHLKLDFVLNKLPAMGYTTVQVHLKPPARYAGENKYVVDIITESEKKVVGLIGNPAVGYDFSDGSFEPSLAIGGSAEKLRFTAKSGARWAELPEKKTERIFNDLVSKTSTNQLQHSENDKIALENEIDLSYDITQKQFLNVGFGYNTSSNRFRESGETFVLKNNLLQNYYTSSLIRNEKITNWNLNTIYQFDFKNPKHNFNAEFSMSKSPQNFTDSLRVAGLSANGDSARSFRKTSNFNEQKLHLNYSLNMASRLGFYAILGVINRSDNEHNRYTSPGASNINGDNTLTNSRLVDFSLVEAMTYLYYKLNKQFSVTADVSGNYFVRNNSMLVTHGGQQKIEQQGLLVSPKISVGYSPKVKKIADRITVSASRTGLRPNENQISSFRKVVVPGLIVTGNPFLKPEKMNSFSVSAGKNKFTLTLSHSFSSDHISPVWKPDDNNLVQTYENTGKYALTSARMHHIWMRPGKYYLNSSLNISYLNSETSGGNSTKGLSLLALNYGNITLIKKIIISGRVVYNDNFLKGYISSRQINPFVVQTSVGYSHQKNNNKVWSAEIGTNLAGWGKTGNRSIQKSEFFEQQLNTSVWSLPLSMNLNIYLGRFNIKPVKTTSQKTINSFL